eukprot:Skav226307  [mRNA]  locus=scaffold3301:504667:510139:+ [translate_table: standard]
MPQKCRKVVVVDQQLAVVGGLDLCIGRYDDWQHRITDSRAAIWKGQDYYNPRIKDVTEGRLQKDLLQRFINSVYEHLPLAMLRRKVAVNNEEMLKLPQQTCNKHWPPEKGPWQAREGKEGNENGGHQESRAQIVRSVGRWSAGTKTESSAHQAYCDLIQDSKHFIYIENQFFCSGLEGDSQIGNRVLEALLRRIVKAHEQRDGRFHVVILLPLLPALEGPLTHGYLPNFGPATEQIYIHSKTMIVDDEVNVVIQDDMGTARASSAGGFRGGTAANLRKALFAQHLGLDREQFDQKFDNLKKDGRTAEGWVVELRRLARRNTEIYEDLFGALPSDKVQTWQQLAACRQVPLKADFTKIPSEEHAKEVLGEVQGYLVEFPLEFLQQEDLAPSVMGGLLGPVFT